MSSRQWAINAVKKSKRQLVPGSSKWLSKEMSAHYENVLTNSEAHFHDFQSYEDDLNMFMKKVMEIHDDEDQLSDLVSVRMSRMQNGSTFSPIRRDKVEQDQLKHDDNIDEDAKEIGTKLELEAENELERVVEDMSNLEFKTSDPAIIPQSVDTEAPIEEAGQDDSFQAISKAIRKSIADKTALGNHFFNTETQLSPDKDTSSHEVRPYAGNTTDSTRKSAITPKRSSLFVSLPAREPITVTSSSKHQSVVRTRSNNSRVFEKLDIASRRETTNTILSHTISKPINNSNIDTEMLDDNFSMSPVKIPLSKRPFAVDTSKDKTNEIETISKQETVIHVTPQQDTILEVPKYQHITYEAKDKDSSSKPSLIDSRIPRLSHHDRNNSEANVIDMSSPEGSSTPLSSRLTTHNTLSTVSTSKKKWQKSPDSKSSLPSRAISISRSISPYRSKSSRSPTTSLERYSSSPVKEEEINLINRLSAPTSASAAKSRSSIAAKNSELKRNDALNTKNRFLTTTLNSSNPQFKLQRPPQLNRKLPLSHIPSPVKPGLSNLEDNTIPKLDSGSIPSLKKKSLMAERSEAAASKPRQKILISVNHTSKISSVKSDIISKEKSDSNTTMEPKSAKRLNERISSRKDVGNAVALPDAARGINIKTTESAKRRKLLKEDKTPSKTSHRRQLLDKSNSLSSGTERRSTFKSMPILYPESIPITPAKRQTYTAETLPDILTDEEDNSSSKSKKILQSWGSTPELRKIVLQNREINPATVFGEVPKLVIEEIFESQASIMRGKQSPDLSPDEKQRRKEEREYAIEMGYR